MIFTPKDLVKKEGSFTVESNVKSVAAPCLAKSAITDLWRGFTYQLSTLEIERTSAPVFYVGSAKPLPLDGQSYAINVEESGVYITAENEKALLTGFMTLIDRIYCADEDEKTVLKIDCCEIRETPLIKNRMVHFCVFPETELWELERFVKLCATLRYTHLIIEFWGMLKYDCMKELAWSFAFTKEEIRPIISLAKDLGLEIIPMFNHWGHASACRVMNGKHVVLDQNPTLQTYFSPEGWCFDITKPKVRALLEKVRDELCELCGDGEYFHIGCDEAYGFDLSTKEGMDAILDFINGVTRDMKPKGRRVIVWGDMFLNRHENYNPANKYCTHAPTLACEDYMLEGLDPFAIVADWQYDATTYPVETSLAVKEHGRDCIICPWDRSFDKLRSCMETAKRHELFGFIHTTWHTLSQGMPYVMLAARGCFEEVAAYKSYDRALTAAHLRRVYPVGGDYAKAGWARNQFGELF